MSAGVRQHPSPMPLSQTSPGSPCKRPRSPMARAKAKRPRLVWSTDDVRALLDIRFSAVALERASACRTAKQKSAWWSWLASIVARRLRRPIVVKQLKNRMDKLKAEYQQVQYAERHVQAHPGASIRYPPYWDAMVKYFQLGETSNLALSTHEETSSGDETDSDQLLGSRSLHDGFACTPESDEPMLRDLIADLSGLIQAHSRRVESLRAQYDLVCRQQGAVYVQIYGILSRITSRLGL